MTVLRNAWDTLSMPWWASRHRAQIAAYDRFQFPVRDVRTLLRLGWVPVHFERLLVAPPGGAHIVQRGSFYVTIAGIVTPEQVQRWWSDLHLILPRPPSRGHALTPDGAALIAQWDRRVGPLAPLAIRAGLSIEEAATLARGNQLTESHLRTLLALRSQ